MFAVFFLKAFMVSSVLTQDITSTNTLRCGKSHFIETIGNARVCQPCPNGTYMDEDGHGHKSCKLCKTYLPEIDHVAKVQPCTREMDTTVEKCKDGFYVQYSTPEARYACALCKSTDCQENAECCSSNSVTATTASTTATTNDNPVTLKPNTDQHKASTCEMVVTQGCLRAEHVNRTCVYVDNSVERSMHCQMCPNVKSITETCTDTSTDRRDSNSLSPGVIVVIIVITCVASVPAAAGILYCYCRRRNKKLIYQLANRNPTDKTDIETSTADTVVRFNSNQDEIVIEQ